MKPEVFHVSPRTISIQPVDRSTADLADAEPQLSTISFELETGLYGESSYSQWRIPNLIEG